MSVSPVCSEVAGSTVIPAGVLQQVQATTELVH
jgi:hypothetical protein